MKIVFATYLDNQKVIQYPIDFIKSEIPDLVVFSSDHSEKQYLLEKHNIQSQVIDIKIHIPDDIGAAQAKCVDILLAKGADFIVWVQADSYMTEEAYRLVKEFCVEGNEDKYVALKTRHLRLFHLGVESNWGVSIIGRKSGVNFISDGAYCLPGGAPRLSEQDTVVDIGYLGIQQYRNHLTQHIKTWKSSDRSHLLSDKDFILQTIKYNKENVGLYDFITEDHKYFPLIEKLGMINEYILVKEIIKQR